MSGAGSWAKRGGGRGRCSVMPPSTESKCRSTACHNLPNFFLTTLRIFLLSNLVGSPCTVVNVLRPLRSANEVALSASAALEDSSAPPLVPAPPRSPRFDIFGKKGKGGGGGRSGQTRWSGRWGRRYHHARWIRIWIYSCFF